VMLTAVSALMVSNVREQSGPDETGP